jgi:Putative peptidoglycan binding domain
VLNNWLVSHVKAVKWKIEGKIMKRILYSVCIGSLALALTAGGAQARDKRSEKAKPQQRTAKVHAARPANTGGTMSAQRNVSAAQYRQRSYAKPRASSNAVVKQNTGLHAVRERNLARNERMRERNFQRKQEFRAQRDVAVNRDRNVAVNRTRNFDANRERNVAVNRTRNFDVNRSRNTDEFSARKALAINRDRNLTVNRTRNFDVNRFRNTNEFRGRNNVEINRDRNVAINRDRNFAVNRTGNAAFYRGRNARITNNWRSDAFRGERYWAFRNYNRQWHDRGWWRSHYDRIIFVNNGWYYWNAGYWFPAWGYAPSVSYVYDGPIYAYNGLSPDQVTVNVQEELAAAGYYDGPIDGLLGPMTREAIAAYQADNGLAVTSAIDEPTLATLGLV